MGAMLSVSGLIVASVLFAGGALLDQTPQPFPRAGASTQAPRVPAPQAPRTQPSAPPQTPPPPAQTLVDPSAPTEAALGISIYPGAQPLGSYDAGRGQRYYLFGTTTPFSEVVLYYQKQTGERGDIVFKDPPTHQFFGEPFARYREETMVFPPGVTVKDWTAGGSSGYPNPKPGATPARFPTIIMIVTPPPATPQQPRR